MRYSFAFIFGLPPSGIGAEGGVGTGFCAPAVPAIAITATSDNVVIRMTSPRSFAMAQTIYSVEVVTAERQLCRLELRVARLGVGSWKLAVRVTAPAPWCCRRG